MVFISDGTSKNERDERSKWRKNYLTVKPIKPWTPKIFSECLLLCDQSDSRHNRNKPQE